MRAITELDEMKSIQLEIMGKIHSFCQKKGIIYFLSHGSLIGAIRHNGFIPWDDDIDIFMPRDSYERFCTEFPKEQNKYELKIVNAYTDTYYGRPMSKVIDTRTLSVEPNYLCDDEIGVNIDIWPLDGTPNNESERAAHAKKMKTYQKLLYGRIVRFKACKGIMQKIGHILLLPISPRMLVKKICLIQKKYNYSDSKVVACYVDPYKKEYEKDWFSKQELCKFEDHEFFVPLEASKILTVIYGDYMKLPPLSQQQPHHITNAFWK